MKSEIQGVNLTSFRCQSLVFVAFCNKHPDIFKNEFWEPVVVAPPHLLKAPVIDEDGACAVIDAVGLSLIHI